jgi:integrase
VLGGRLYGGTKMVCTVCGGERFADFRSCRDSGITWLALSGLDVAKIQRRAGHEDVSTTLGYVKMAEDLGGKVGVPFAPLPRELVWAMIGPSRHLHGKNTIEIVPEEGIEPPT